MMLRNSELSGLRDSLMAVLLAGLVAAASVLLGRHQLELSRLEFLAAQQELSAAHHVLAATRNDQPILPAYAALYRNLQQAQVISASPPVFRLITESLRPLTLDMHYTFSAPHPLPQQETDRLLLMEHPVHLQLELLHEGRLLELLDGLRTGGWFMLERCSVEPTESALRADCTGNWITVSNHASP